MGQQQVPISTTFITLDSFLKWACVANTGGHAKAIIVSGHVKVNGEVELRRGRKLYPGDLIDVQTIGQWLISGKEG